MTVLLCLEILSLTKVEHVSCRDKSHEVDPRGERHHADQDERHVADVATKHNDAEVTGEEDHAACRVPITHLEEERDTERYRRSRSK